MSPISGFAPLVTGQLFPGTDAVIEKAHCWNQCWLYYLYFAFWAHDDVIKLKHFPRDWTLVRGIHRSPVNSPHKGQWRRALMFSLICLTKWLSKQSWGWWFQTPSCSLWRHCNSMIDLRNSPFRILLGHVSQKVRLVKPNQHIEAGTKWRTFSRRLFHMHFLERKCLSFK